MMIQILLLVLTIYFTSSCSIHVQAQLQPGQQPQTPINPYSFTFNISQAVNFTTNCIIVNGNAFISNTSCMTGGFSYSNYYGFGFQIPTNGTFEVTLQPSSFTQVLWFSIGVLLPTAVNYAPNTNVFFYFPTNYGLGTISVQLASPSTTYFWPGQSLATAEPIFQGSNYNSYSNITLRAYGTSLVAWFINNTLQASYVPNVVPTNGFYTVYVSVPYGVGNGFIYANYYPWPWKASEASPSSVGLAVGGVIPDEYMQYADEYCCSSNLQYAPYVARLNDLGSNFWDQGVRLQSNNGPLQTLFTRPYYVTDALVQMVPTVTSHYQCSGYFTNFTLGISTSFTPSILQQSVVSTGQDSYFTTNPSTFQSFQTSASADCSTYNSIANYNILGLIRRSPIVPPILATAVRFQPFVVAYGPKFEIDYNGFPDYMMNPSISLGTQYGGFLPDANFTSSSCILCPYGYNLPSFARFNTSVNGNNNNLRGWYGLVGDYLQITFPVSFYFNQLQLQMIASGGSYFGVTSVSIAYSIDYVNYQTFNTEFGSPWIFSSSAWTIATTASGSGLSPPFPITLAQGFIACGVRIYIQGCTLQCLLLLNLLGNPVTPTFTPPIWLQPTTPPTASTSIPTTQPPTTSVPSTGVPTTLPPSTMTPSTLIPSTALPTTAIPTTVPPFTVQTNITFAQALKIQFRVTTMNPSSFATSLTAEYTVQSIIAQFLHVNVQSVMNVTLSTSPILHSSLYKLMSSGLVYISFLLVGITSTGLTPGDLALPFVAGIQSPTSSLAQEFQTVGVAIDSTFQPQMSIIALPPTVLPTSIVTPTATSNITLGVSTEVTNVYNSSYTTTDYIAIALGAIGIACFAIIICYYISRCIKKLIEDGRIPLSKSDD